MQTFLATFLAAEKFRTQQSTERCLGRIKTDINWENRLRQEAQLLSFLSLPLSFFPSFLWTPPSQTVSTFILPHTNFTYLSIYLSLSLSLTQFAILFNTLSLSLPKYALISTFCSINTQFPSSNTVFIFSLSLSFFPSLSPYLSRSLTHKQKGVSRAHFHIK